MAGRRLSAEERALWSRLAQTVRSYRPSAPAKAEPQPVPAVAVAKPLARQPIFPSPSQPARKPAAVLDNGWEKQIKRGVILPDMTIDLHGHSLSAAHLRLDQALTTARARDVRVLLVVTGKPRPSREAGRSGQRGAIRAEIGHWLDSSAHADAIASVRTAHPRHGGEGALYVILRRRKG